MTTSSSNLLNFDPRKIPVVGIDAHLPPVGLQAVDEGVDGREHHECDEHDA